MTVITFFLYKFIDLLYFNIATNEITLYSLFIDIVIIGLYC
jgi:hypothetical protein